MSFAPPGWYRDPYERAILRWWDGTKWTAQTSNDFESDTRRIVEQFPWKSWIIPTVAVVIAGVFLFGHAEDTATSDPEAWFVIGFAASGAITFLAACVTLVRRHWVSVAVFAAVMTCAATLAVFTATAPSTSRSCNNAGRPSSGGTYDCDTSYGLGLPIVVGVLFVPAGVIASAGKVAGDTCDIIRRRHASRRERAAREA